MLKWIKRAPPTLDDSVKRRKVLPRSVRERVVINSLEFKFPCQLIDIVLGFHVENTPEIFFILHWGIYSVPAFDSLESAKRRTIQNGSEWYLKRLITKPTDFRPTTGWRETQAYHAKHYPNKKYADFANDFTAKSWNPDAWMDLFSKINGTCAILTAKHHDSFCMWDTKTTSNNSMNSAAKQDILLRFKESCNKKGLKFGIYYSWSEFERPCNKQYMDQIVVPQINELIKYGPDVFWFDGDWFCNTAYSQQIIDKCCTLIKRALPNVEINDRIGHKSERQDPNYLGHNMTYRVYADRTIPKIKPLVPFESIQTVGFSWGLNKQQKLKDHKSAKQLHEMCQKVHQLGGRFLINVGPDCDGTLCPIESQILSEFANLVNL